jgi:hypothetical protein
MVLFRYIINDRILQLIKHIYLEGKQCGDTHGSCKNDLKAVETTGIILLTIFSVFMIWFLATSIYCFCSHRKRRAAGGFDPERRTINEAHIQQQVDIHINFDTPMNIELLIIEAPPPSYEQIQKKEAKDGCENI